MVTHWFSGKEKVPGAVVSKEGNADCILGHKRPITTDFLGYGAIINSASYCEHLWQNSPDLLNEPCVCMYFRSM